MGFEGTRLNPIDRRRQGLDRQDIEALHSFLGHITGRHDGAPDAVLDRLAQAVRTIGDGPDLPGQAHLAEGHQIERQGTVAITRQHRQQYRWWGAA